MRNKIFTKIILTTLMCALLTMTVGRATRVFALAQPIQQIQPVYDTEIFALKDYVETNLDNPHLDVFFLITGALAVAQLGAQDAMLESPYPNESSVKEWIINCGIQLYNSVIGLVPSGDYFINIPLVGQPQSAVKGIPRSMIKALTAQMMGNAVVARNYSSVDDFLADDTQHLMPFQRPLQQSINAIWQLQGGPFHWQFDTSPFSSNSYWNEFTNVSPLIEQQYDAAVESLQYPYCRVNNASAGNSKNFIFSAQEIGTYHNLFLREDLNRVYIVNDAGQSLDTSQTFNTINITRSTDGTVTVVNTSTERLGIMNYYFTYDPNEYDTYVDVIQAIYDFEISSNGPYHFIHLFFDDFIEHVYVGTNWVNKQELYNIQSLNISEDMNEYYKSPDEDVFIDIKDMVENLVNKTSIWDFLIDHLFDIDGNLIIPNFPTFSVDLTPITELLAPPIPVDLNDFALYTENDYLEEIKNRAENFSSTIGEYFVFWHNADPVTVYVLFGSIIVILLGAFVGKLGHS